MLVAPCRALVAPAPGARAPPRRALPWLLALPAARATARRAVRYEQWQGHRIRCSSAEGTEQVHVVLVHGFGGSIDYWRHLMPFLEAQGYAVHAMDLLGLGLSEKPERTYGIELWGEQVADFVKGLKKDVRGLGALRFRAPKGVLTLSRSVSQGGEHENSRRRPL